ncbi:MAG: O-antigen ligase family protein, partial [Proteobacteria bacterium]|nr:O-antigen ligase family protein [Pseudomonadota bacterium]
MYGRVLFTVALISVFVQGFDLWSLTVISIALLALAAAGTLGAFDRSEGIQAGAIGLILVLLSLWLFLSAWLSPLTAVVGIGMFQQLVLPLAFLAFLIAPDQAGAGRQLALFSAVLCILLTLIALAEPLYSNFPTFTAFFVQRNSLSGYVLLLSFILLPVLGRVLRDGAASRATVVLWCVPIFLSFFLVCFSTSRAAIGAFVVGYGGFFLSLDTQDRRRLGKPVLALALYAFLLADVSLKGEVSESMKSLQAVSTRLSIHGIGLIGDLEQGQLVDLSPIARSKVASANERFLIWRATLEMVKEMPLSGFGPGTFRAVYPGFGYEEDRSSRHYAHNDFLQIIAELGVLGLALCMALVTAIVIRWLKHRRLGGNAGDRNLEADGLFWGMVTLGSHSFFTYNFYVPATLVMFGFVLARFVRITRPEAAPHPSRMFRNFSRPVMIFIIFVLAAIPMAALISALAMSVFHERGMRELDVGALSDAQRSLRIAANLSPNPTTEAARAHLYLAASDSTAEFEDKLEFIGLAETHLARAAKMNPFSAAVAYTEMLFVLHDPRLDPASRFDKVQKAYRETLRRDHRYYPA